MKYIDLFGGVGGFSLAIKRAIKLVEKTTDSESRKDSEKFKGEWGWGKSSNDNGWQCVGYYEIDKYAVKTYNKNFGTDYKPTDITKLDTADIPDFDLLCAGFPCQAFSIAGKRKGFADTRGTLFFEICRIVKDKRPSYLLLENVKGLLSHDEGRTFRTIISSLDELGYDCQWQVLNSKFFGVPQNRERVFIIGHLRGKPRPKVFPLGQSNSINNQEHKEQIARTITEEYYKQGQWEQYIQMINRMPNGVEQIARIYDTEGISPTLQTPSEGHHIPKIAQALRNLNRNGPIQNENNFFTVQTSEGRENGVWVGNKIRRLTPKECERLQGFPDDWTIGVSDTQRYKQMGNAITVNVVEHIIRIFREVSEP